jgi:ribosome-associated toxin RatA of RatAB toxin-antitoxin module
MKIRLFLSFLLVASVVVQARAADEKKEPPKPATKTAVLEPFKALEGEWVGKMIHEGKPGPEAHVTYKVTSAGSAVVETLDPGGDHEMVTIIHPDGNDLVLTHYCAIGNQPRMKAPGKIEDNKIAFKFVSATNMKSDKDMHMHDVTFTFVDKDTLKTEWTHYMDGKAAGNVVFEFKRKK